MIESAMILAAGFGTRMKTLTTDLPKPLLTIAEIPLLEISVRKLISHGINHIVINSHYHSKKIADFLQSKADFGIQIELIYEAEILGTGGGIANAEPAFNRRPILVMNSDIICDLNLDEFISICEQKKAWAAMAVKPSVDVNNYSLVKYSDGGRITGFLSKGENLPPTGHTGIFTGIQYLTPDARMNLSPKFSSVITDVYRNGISAGKNIIACPISGNWLDFGTKEQYENYNILFQNGELKIENFIR